MINKHWPRWIEKAILKHFDELGREGLFVQHRGSPNETDSHQTFIKIRIAGPTFNTMPSNRYRGDVQVSVLIQTPEEESEDMYAMSRLSGEVAEKFTCIEVYDDDDTYVETLNLIPWIGKSRVNIIDYGEIPDLDHLRCVVIGDYYIDLNSEGS